MSFSVFCNICCITCKISLSNKNPPFILEGCGGFFGGTRTRNRTGEVSFRRARLWNPPSRAFILDIAAGVAGPASLSDNPSARATFSGRRNDRAFLGVASTSYRALIRRRPTPPLLPRKAIFGRSIIITLLSKNTIRL